MDHLMPLAGLRVIDLGRVWSGPLATRILGDFGAEVIKVEALSGRGEFSGPASRQTTLPEEFPGRDPGLTPWNRSSMFNDLNRNKLSLTLDLSRPLGVAVFKKLVTISDIVVENYTPRVMVNFGLHYRSLQTCRADLIMLSMPAYGMTGPYREYPGYGNTIEPVAGITNLVGYPGDRPHPLGMIAGDVLAALHGVSAIMVALWHRQQTGQGQYIDLSQAETQTSVIGDVLLDYQMDGLDPLRRGNRHPFMAPHGCYRCRGEDSWVVIAVDSDDRWQRLCQVMGNRQLAGDHRFAHSQDRWQNQDEIDRVIQAWTVHHDHYDVMYRLQAVGIACGPVLNGREVLDDTHLNQRGFFVDIPHPEAGTHKYAGVPVKLSDTPAILFSPAPCLGEHNRSVLQGLLGMKDPEVAELERQGIIGRRPPVPGP